MAIQPNMEERTLTKVASPTNLVTQKINDFTYHIQLGTQTKPKVVYRNRLWNYSGNNLLTWLQTNTIWTAINTFSPYFSLPEGGLYSVTSITCSTKIWRSKVTPI